VIYIGDVRVEIQQENRQMTRIGLVDYSWCSLVELVIIMIIDRLFRYYIVSYSLRKELIIMIIVYIAGQTAAATPKYSFLFFSSSHMPSSPPCSSASLPYGGDTVAKVIVDSTCLLPVG